MYFLKSFIRSCLYNIGVSLSFIYSYTLSRKYANFKSYIFTGWISREFKKIYRTAQLSYPIVLIGGKYISIGDKSVIGKRAVITAWDARGNETYCPHIKIGNNVSIGDDCHITAINKIEIGDNVLIGKKITLTDNSHGKSEIEVLKIPPSDRPLYSEGPIIIEEGVWIGDKVTVLPNVQIGKNAVIGANAVVTKDIPANCIAVGIPAKVIKVIE